MTGSTRLGTARSLLFVPGTRPDRYDKALASGADVVVVDLEDAVAPDQKPAALAHVRTWLEEDHAAVVRLNAPGTPWHDDELAAVGHLGLGVVVPKAERPEALAAVVDVVGAGRVVALVETARGLRAVEDLAEVAGLARLAFGNVDLAVTLGVNPDSHLALAAARSSVVLASAAGGLPAPVDGVTTALTDQTALEADLAHARELGFGGKLCLHPAQVSAVNLALSPSPDELAWATRIVESVQGRALVELDGHMVDAPVLARAHAILDRQALLES